MRKYILIFSCFVLSLPLLIAQGNCIEAPAVGCRFSCVDVIYTGSAPDTAAYFWSSSCGTFANPNQQDPGNLCLFFPGNCTIQLVVIESGQAPDTCATEIIVLQNPDGIMEGDTTVCSGDCASISVFFPTGVAPFTYQVDDGLITDIYTAATVFDTFTVCPLFSTTYTLVSITDAFGCTVSGQFNAVNIDVTPGVTASITQNGNQLCANPPGQNYQWWNCDYSQLQGITECITLTQDNCYCLIVGDAVTSCVDTVCGDFILPCPLTCEIIAPDSVCLGDSIQFVYNGNASDLAEFDWTITVDTTIYTFIGDTVNFVASDFNCINASLLVTDTSCQTTCTQEVCIYSHLLFATLYEDIATCDSCTTIPIGLSGTAPYTVYITDGVNVDTITGILTDQYDYAVCPPVDSTVHFVLLNATDSLSSCPVILGVDSVSVTRYSVPVAEILQNGNSLCADSTSGSFAWYDCGFTQLLSDSSCFDLTQSGCYCLVVINGTCTDTICNEFVFDSCELTCNIELVPNACIGDSIVFAYSGNASSGAIFNWLIDLPGFPGSPYSGDTVILAYSQPGCYQVSLTVFDQGCISNCADSICIAGPNSEASICCDQISCDSCADLSITLTGTPPWTVFIGNGTQVDTITGITSSPYVYNVCPPRDSAVTYTLLGVQDTINNCPGYIVGTNTATVTLHDPPTASITQIVDLLCANPSGMAGYGWYTCPAGPYLDTSRCFLPSVSGCYCVDVSNEFDCVDTACINIILSATEENSKQPFTIHPNPFQDVLDIQLGDEMNLPVHFELINMWGQTIDKGEINERNHRLHFDSSLPGGIYLIQIRAKDNRMSTVRLNHQ